MRFFLRFPAILLSIAGAIVQFYPAAQNLPSLLKLAAADSGIYHKTDGITAEWPSSKFENDISTDISYAIDNDSENLYLALKIPNQGIQAKLEKTGMKLFIDIKGKKKEGRSITFPVKDETAAEDNNGYAKATGIPATEVTSSEPGKLPDIKTRHSMMALHLTYMNVAGFEGMKAHDQGLKMPASINIAFAWDSANVMHIEYLVPLKMLDIPSASQKEISIGWRINGIYSSDNYQQGPEHTHKRPSPGYGTNTTGFDPSRKTVTHEAIIRENNIWTKYTLLF